MSSRARVMGAAAHAIGLAVVAGAFVSPAGCATKTATRSDRAAMDSEPRPRAEQATSTRRISLHLAKTQVRFRHGHRVRFCVSAGASWQRCGDFAVAGMEIEVPAGEPIVLTASAAGCSFMTCEDAPTHRCRAAIDGEELVFTPFNEDCVAPGSAQLDPAQLVRIERPRPGSSTRGWWASLVVDDEVVVHNDFPLEVVAFWTPARSHRADRLRMRLGRLAVAVTRVEACTRSAMSLPKCAADDPVPVCEWPGTREDGLAGERLFIGAGGCTAAAIEGP